SPLSRAPPSVARRDRRATRTRPPQATLPRRRRRGAAIKAVRLHAYKAPPTIDDVAEPGRVGGGGGRGARARASPPRRGGLVAAPPPRPPAADAGARDGRVGAR